MKLVKSRHVVVVSDKVWEDAKVYAIRKHKTLGEYIEEALIEKLLGKKVWNNLVDSKKGKKIRNKLVDNKKGKNID